MRPAVFLDRDGVLIDDRNYLDRVDLVALIPGAAAAVRRLNDAGFAVVVVTNQSGVARGVFPEEQIAVVHAHIAGLLHAEAAARIDHFDYSPFHPDATVEQYRRDSDCRKPKPGMLLRSAVRLNLDLPRSWMVGDRLTDLEAGAAAGCRTILVRTGYGERAGLSAPLPEVKLEVVVPTVVEAVAHILADDSGA